MQFANRESIEKKYYFSQICIKRKFKKRIQKNSKNSKNFKKFQKNYKNFNIHRKIYQFDQKSKVTCRKKKVETVQPELALLRCKLNNFDLGNVRNWCWGLKETIKVQKIWPWGPRGPLEVFVDFYLIWWIWVFWVGLVILGQKESLKAKIFWSWQPQWPWVPLEGPGGPDAIRDHQGLMLRSKKKPLKPKKFYLGDLEDPSRFMVIFS